MAKSYELNIAAHPSIYDGSERELTVWFCEPEQGVTADTGILLLSSSFGEEPNNEKYRQIRERFADAYNFVTVQCAYFGSRFMGPHVEPKFILNVEAIQKVFTPEEWELVDGGDHIRMDQLLRIGSNYPIHLEGDHQMDESLREFNDMGIMQALDNIAAVLTVAAILEDNKLPFNLSRMMTYGHGHAAYIHHLCNALAPQLFAAQIDYGSWLYPDYLMAPRVLNLQNGKLTQSVVFNYLAIRQPKDMDFQRLSSLYKRFKNRCQLLCFEDLGVASAAKQSEKRAFCSSVPYATYFEAGGIQEVSKRIPADYVGLFDYVMTHMSLGDSEAHELSLPNSQIHTPAYRYDILYNQGLPQLTRTSKAK